MVRRPKGYWQNFGNLEKETIRIMQNEGWETLPSPKVLRKRGYSYLVSAAFRTCGGLAKLREKLGQKEVYVKKGRWQSLEFTLHKAREAMENEDWQTLPGAEVLGNRGYHGIVNSAKMYHGGLPNIREQLGHNRRLRIADGQWKDLTYIKAEARRIMSEHGWSSLPSVGALWNGGYNSFVVAATKYHGGIPKLRKILGQEPHLIIKSGDWKSVDFTTRKAIAAMEKEGWPTLPSNNILRKAGYNSLSSAISKYHGGFPVFRRQLSEHSSQPSEQEQLEVLVGGYDG